MRRDVASGCANGESVSPIASSTSYQPYSTKRLSNGAQLETPIGQERGDVPTSYPGLGTKDSLSKMLALQQE